VLKVIEGLAGGVLQLTYTFNCAKLVEPLRNITWSAPGSSPPHRITTEYVEPFWLDDTIVAACFAVAHLGLLIELPVKVYVAVCPLITKVGPLITDCANEAKIDI
jgi:hypothetical protein